jgi:8-hydroxy-5-deazaflavin:NADPH oxidoreductase
MTTAGFIGSGQIGSAIARLAIEAGHQVVLSNSRGPETLADLAAELGPRASAATSGEAAAAGDIVVVTVPVKAFPDLPVTPLAGKTVIDTCNYGPERDGHFPDLDGKSLTSSELLLRYIPDAMLVKAFNNVFFKHLLSLARPAGAADRSYLPIAGDSAPAKAAVTEFIDSIGYSVVELVAFRIRRDMPCPAVLANRTPVSPAAPKPVTRRTSAVRSRVCKSR